MLFPDTNPDPGARPTIGYQPRAGQRLIDVDGQHILLFGGSGCPMSNFAASAMRWPCPHCGESLHVATVEHAFQAAKATSCPETHRVAGASSASEARSRGRRVQLRADWEAPTGAVAGRRVSFKAEVMWGLLRTKFSTLEHAATLQDTGELVLVEDAPWDPFWGAGKDGRGTNVLGRLLMTLRQELAGTPTTLAAPTPPIPR